MKIIKIKNYIKEKSKGFTLIETMVAIFILGMITTTLMGVIATNLYNFRYTQNEMTATYLLQEAADYIRNHRDTEILNSSSEGSYSGWDSFIQKYNECSNDPCKIDTTKDFNSEDFVSQCEDDSCGNLYFNNNPDDKDEFFYSYVEDGNQETFFERQIRVKQIYNSDTGNGDEVWVEIKVNWKNGNLPRSKTLTFSLLRWLS